MFIIQNDCTDPAFNLAAEEYLLDHFPGNVFMLWRNQRSVIVGKNQNTAGEVDARFVSANNIPVIRRLTGGGAVFHDLGNINYTCIEREDGGHFSDYAHFTADLIDFLATLGVKAELSGRNDLLVAGKKICGNAQCVRNGRVMHHGCILYSADLSGLARALRAKKEKFAGKGIQSVSSRVTNIIDHMADRMDAAGFMDAFGRFVAERHGYAAYPFSADDIDRIGRLAKEKYATWAWNYGHSPDYNFSDSQKFDFGLVEIYLSISGGMIRSAKIAGDFFGRRDVGGLEEALTGLAHNADAVEKVLQGYDIGAHISGCSMNELIELLI
ncbi:MAG: lipoate--protein ligase [Oscillospiraceae bacterium]|nr:lipoate--protein ligase [Oscillospiraceae bacterium]